MAERVNKRESAFEGHIKTLFDWTYTALEAPHTLIEVDDDGEPQEYVISKPDYSISAGLWVRFPQGCNYTHVKDVPEEFIFGREQPPCTWACAVYRVDPDGTLKLMEEQWDTSD